MSLVVSDLASIVGPFQTREALCVLVEHQLVSFSPEPSGRAEYRCERGAVQQLLSLPRCVAAAKTLFGERAEALVEELGSRATLTLSECIRRAGSRLETAGAFGLIVNGAHIQVFFNGITQRIRNQST